MDNDSDSDDILNDLLANDEAEEKEAEPKRTLQELDFNFLDSAPEISNENKSPVNQQDKSLVYQEADSSDDEDRRNFEEQKYTEYGRDIKSLLKKDTANGSNDTSLLSKPSGKSFDINKASKQNTGINPVVNNVQAARSVDVDPFFGLRIVSPLVSSAELRGRMVGKTPVTVSKIKYHINMDKTENDWVIAGVLITKSQPKTSQKGSVYAIWKISDLSENMSTVCLFMFSNAYNALWKTTIGTVIGILNPNIMECKDDKDLATLSIDNPQKMMILGTSKDMGKCRSTKKNGEKCTSIVNISRCEYCIYHVKQEYKKCSRRSELQSYSNTQNFSIEMLKKRNKQQLKPLNSSNMPDFVPVYAVKNEKLIAKDAKRLALLSGACPKGEKNFTDSLKDKASKEVSTGSQEKKRFDDTNRSRGWKATMLLQSSSNKEVIASSPTSSKSCFSNQAKVQNGLSALSFPTASPRLGAGCSGNTIDLSTPITKKHIRVAKSNAIKWVQENGKIKEKNPNKVRLNKEEKLEKGKKRPRETEDEQEEAKKPALFSDKFKEMMQAKSAHTDLIEKSLDEEKEKYFTKLEMKERMEEKMLTTYKVACKAVRCLICKYTSFSASDMCKEQRHPLRVADATKRFFKCADCGNRTVTLDRIPSHSCIKCNSSSWTRAAMMDERKTKVAVASLSIRGDEESHIGSIIKEANLNLLVPDADGK